MAPAQHHRHLDSEALAKLAGLQLRVQAVVEGTLSGLHRSPHHGSSIEFAEHKEYTPGDDLRHLDWKAFGKFDRYYIKRYEDETDLKAYLLLDCSGSMAYGGSARDQLSKLELGSVLLASLAFFLSRQGDQPGLLAFADRVRAYLPPRARSAHLNELLSTLEGLRPGGSTDLARAVLHLTEVIAHRTLVVLVSDLFSIGSDGLHLLRSLRARNHHVVIFHLLHPDELEFPFSELTLFESMEDERAVLCDPGGIRKAYLAEITRFLEASRRICRDSEIEYHPISTAQPVDEVLLEFLHSSRRRRTTTRARGHSPASAEQPTRGDEG